MSELLTNPESNVMLILVVLVVFTALTTIFGIIIYYQFRLIRKEQVERQLQLEQMYEIMRQLDISIAAHNDPNFPENKWSALFKSDDSHHTRFTAYGENPEDAVEALYYYLEEVGQIEPKYLTQVLMKKSDSQETK